MDHSGCLRSHQSPKACRNRARHKRAAKHQAPQLPHNADEEDDWEMDPDYVNHAGRQCGELADSMASMVSDLSRSIRGCSLRRPVPHNKKEYADHHQGPLGGSKDSAWMPAKDPEGRRPAPLCPQVRSSPSLGIERSSVFNRNAAETLDAFFSEKLKAWASDDSQLSDSYENMETPQDPARLSKCRGRTEKAHAGPERTSRRQNPSRPVPARGMVVDRTCSSWDNYQPGVYYDQSLRHDPLSKGEMSAGPRERQEGRGPSTAASSSARILPQCRISHVQSCEACQAFNRELPAGQEAFYGECWPPLCEEGGDRGAGRKRTGASSQRQLSKVQQWLEQTPVDKPPRRPKAEKQAGLVPAGPPAPGRCAAHGSREPKEGDPWGRVGDAGDRWSLENPAEARQGRKPHKARGPGHQPAARIVTCDDTHTSPTVCSCLFCERQKARAKSSPAKREGKKRTDPSVQEVAVQLQAENRVPRIVEAFERRSQREAKMAERDRTFQSSRQRGLEQRAQPAKSRGAASEAPTHRLAPRHGSHTPRSRRSRGQEQGQAGTRSTAMGRSSRWRRDPVSWTDFEGCTDFPG